MPKLKKKEKGSDRQGFDKEQENVTDLWEGIGFHKAIAGYWYRFGLTILAMAFAGTYVFFLFSYLFPYPIAQGYKSTATGIFVLFFRVFDLGTNMTIDRFIAEAKIKNPQKMLHYIQYFIWYQMMTGLIQTTAIALYALYLVPQTELAYTVWLMLINSLTQYPGFLGVFSGILSALQYFDKAQKVRFIGTEIVQRLTEAGFIILGKLYGGANPEIGPIMGIAMGAIIGKYADNFIATGLSAYYFQKIMGDQGIGIRDCFRIDFDMTLVKETFVFGIKTGVPGLLSALTETVILALYLIYMPQYTTYIALMTFATETTHMINFYGNDVPIQPLITEAYMNGKKKLTQYYIGQSIKITALTQCFMVPTILFLMGGLEHIYPLVGMDRYIISIPFLIPSLFPTLLMPYERLADRITVGTNHASFLMIIRTIEEVLKVVFVGLFLVVLALPEKYGFTAITWVLACGTLPATLFKTIFSFIYASKKIVPIKVPWWQSFGATTGAGILVYLFATGAKFLVWNPLMGTKWELLGIIGTILITILGILILYFPATGLLGGWDDDSLAQFGIGARMSGVAKIVVIPFYKSVKIMTRRTKLHNRFRLPYDEAYKEAEELLLLKNANKKRLENKETSLI